MAPSGDTIQMLTGGSDTPSHGTHETALFDLLVDRSRFTAIESTDTGQIRVASRGPVYTPERAAEALNELDRLITTFTPQYVREVAETAEDIRTLTVPDRRGNQDTTVVGLYVDLDTGEDRVSPTDTLGVRTKNADLVAVEGPPPVV